MSLFPRLRLWGSLLLRKPAFSDPSLWEEFGEEVENLSASPLLPLLARYASDPRVPRTIARRSPQVNERRLYRVLLRRRTHLQLASNPHLSTLHLEHLALQMVETLADPRHSLSLIEERRSAAQALERLSLHPQGIPEPVWESMMERMRFSEKESSPSSVDPRGLVTDALARMKGLRPRHVEAAYRHLGASDLLAPLLEQEACPVEICEALLPEGKRYGIILRAIAAHPQAMRLSHIRAIVLEQEGRWVAPRLFRSAPDEELPELLPHLIRHHPATVLDSLEECPSRLARLLTHADLAELLGHADGEIRLRAIRLTPRLLAQGNLARREAEA